MTRCYAKRAATGTMLVRGALIRRTQQRLTQAGFSTDGIDGLFGRGTERGLTQFQKAKNLTVTGALDETTWPSLFPDQAPPEDFDLALALTSTFEGHGFEKAVGNFDGAGVTWGIIGFTLSNGELRSVLEDIEAAEPGSLDQAFGPMAPELRSILAAARADRIAWADGISLGARKYHLREDWALGFARLGARDSAQAVQIHRARTKYWQIAQRDAEQFGLVDLPGLALCFDIAVQNGGINEVTEISAAFAAEPDATPQRRREIVAERVALGSRRQYQADVRSRKMTIATGQGTVHGGRYVTADWGIA